MRSWIVGIVLFITGWWLGSKVMSGDLAFKDGAMLAVDVMVLSFLVSLVVEVGGHLGMKCYRRMRNLRKGDANV